MALRHRSFLSHFPGLGTAGRVLYALGIPAAVALALGWRPGMLFAWYFGWWCAGLLVSDARWRRELKSVAACGLRSGPHLAALLGPE